MKKEIKKIKEEMKEIMKDMNINIEENEENEKIMISDLRKIEILSYYDKDLSDDIINEIFEKKYQIHNSIDRDIKIDMRKINNYNLKLIYHRKKNNEKEYRLFISYKDNDNKLRRIRYINDEIKKIHSNENDMIKLFNDISYQKINNYINKKIS